MANGKKPIPSAMQNQGRNHRRQKIVKMKIKTSWKNVLVYAFLFLFAMFLFVGVNNQQPFEDAKTVPLSQVMLDVKNGKVSEIEVLENKLIIKKEKETLQSYKEPGTNVYQIFKDAGIQLDKTKVVIKDQAGLNNWLNIISSILPIILMVAFFYFIFRQARGAQESIFSFGQSRAKLFSKDTPKIGFADVAGVDEAKQELTEIVDFLKNPAKYKAMGARTPKGVLMIGPSGTGKTLLARGTAGEAGVSFFSIAGSEFMEMLVGVGAARTRDLFNTAKKHQPAIIFIDEIDAIGRQRGIGLMGGHDEREQTLNQILVEMDGFTPNEQLIVMAASVVGDTPIMLKKEGEVKVMPIGNFVDSYYKDQEEGAEKETYGIETLGFDKVSSRINGLSSYAPAFKKVRGVFRHKVNEIYEISYTGGKVKSTSSHSVFVRDGNEIKAKQVSELKQGDILVDFPYKHVWSQYNGKKKEKVKSIKSKFYSLRLPVYLTSDIQKQAMEKYVYAMERGGILSQQRIGQDIGVSQLTVSHWQRQDRLPRLISRAYFKHNLPEEVLVSPELCRLMGYYVSEGYARKEIDFCFNKKETKLIKDVMQLMQLIFSLKPHSTRIRRNAINITYQARPLADFFVFHCGKGAHNKHLPPFLFTAPKEYFVEFLKGVFEGDGYQDKKGKGEITSVSKQLILELNWLCRLHGIKTYMRSFTAKEGRSINGGKPLRAVVAYRLGWGKTANPFLETSKTLAKRPKVQSIIKLPYDGYVYDLCGCDNEAFFGGESPILLHNTNRPDVLDPALVRPGRFDRRIVLDMPDIVGRKAILAIHAKGKPFVSNVNWEKVAKRTVGFSGADLENMLNEAAILAARLGKKAIDMPDLEEAATKVKLGPEKKRLQSEEDRKMTAYHEAGHAIVSWEMPHMDPIHRISIVSRGLSLGHTMMEPTEHIHETKTRLLEQIAVMLGGRAAENLVFKEMTTGASDDIAKATEVARTMVVEYGMSALGPINLEAEQKTFYNQKTISPGMASKIDEHIKKITDAGYQTAMAILVKVKKELDIIAKELLKKETIDADSFVKLLGPKKALAKSNLALTPAS